MRKIIDPIPKETLLKELTMDRFIRKTNNGKNEIYILNAFNAPNVVREIGRLREISFRDTGGGTGLDCDLDRFDLDEGRDHKGVGEKTAAAVFGDFGNLHTAHLKLSRGSAGRADRWA